MELRRLSLYLALFVLAICFQSCADAHAMHKRSNDELYDDVMGDEATDDEAQNDEGNEGDDKTEIEEMLSVSGPYNWTVGKTVRLPCKVKPNNHPVVWWYKDDKPIMMGRTGISDPRLKLSTDAGDHDLLVSDVRPSDGGNYTCKVVQYEGLAMVTYNVTVIEAPIIKAFTASANGPINTHNGVYTLLEGSDLTLTCNVSGSPPPQIMWSRSDDTRMNIRLQEDVAEFTLNSAVIRNINHSLSGSYFCYALNKGGHTEKELKVKVLQKPRVHVHKTVVNSAQGIQAVLQCSTHGDPAPTISWHKDDTEIQSSETHTIVTEGLHSTLTVTPRGDEDFGTFTCRAKNAHASHEKSVSLVQVPVVEDVFLDGRKLAWNVISHLELDAVELQLVNIEENPDAIKSIVIKDIPSPTNHSKYPFTAILEDLTAGTYQVLVKAKNAKGWGESDRGNVVEYESEPLSIQTASVISHSIRPAANALLSTVFMYLLVRVF